MPSKAHLVDAKNDLDRSTDLCLACSSSLPPLKHSSDEPSSSTRKADPNAIFTTNCCQRPICPACIKSNPRLARYDPCLACLGGVSVVGSRSASGGTLQLQNGLKSPAGTIEAGYNFDGAVRDEDTFVLGDDEDEDDDDDDDFRPEYISGAGGVVFENVHHDSAPPPPYAALDGQGPTFGKADEKPLGAFKPEDESVKPVSLPRNRSSGSDLVVSAPPSASAADEEFASSSSAPYKYYVSRGDTLQGISLRFGVDSQEICKLNKLPTSVMRTMPQLLHTRAFLLLPASASASAKATTTTTTSTTTTTTTSNDTKSALKTTPITDDKVRQREARLVRERAGKKLQTLTKEVDYHVAKAYVALADDPEEQEMSTVKRKEMMGSSSSTSAPRVAGGSGTLSAGGSGPGRGPRGELETLAIQQYLEDNEWEEEERRAGRGPRTHPRPPPSPFSFTAIASKVGL